MIKKTNSCILPTKYIKNKQVLMALAVLMFMLNSLIVNAYPGRESATNNDLQPITVAGTVTDEDNNPLAGVYVVVEGTNTGVITNVDGKYSIEVPDANAKLVFSYIGFNSETVEIAGKSVLNLTMVPDITALDEVVVIGYGTQRKEL